MANRSVTELRQVTEKIFTAAGAPADLATEMADALVGANLAGHDSHGVIRIPAYLRMIREQPLLCPMDGVAFSFSRENTEFVLKHHELFSSAVMMPLGNVRPLIPLNGADITDNWSSAPGTDLPTVFFLARFANVGMLLVCGVFGFLLVRRYGLGLLVGGAVASGWLTLTGATQQTDSPIGPAYFNPGALLDPTGDDLKPYIVTIAGVALLFFFALVAIAMALIDTD